MSEAPRPAAPSWRDFAPRSAADLGWIVVLALAYWATAVLGLRWAVIPGAGTPFWPAAGIALFALSVGGVRLWPGVVAGRLMAAVTVASPQPFWADLIIAVGTTLGAVAPALLLRGMPGAARLRGLPSILWLILGGGVLGATISTGFGAGALTLSGIEGAEVMRAAVNWWFGFVTGVLTVAPLLLIWRARDDRAPPWGGWPHLAVAVAVNAGVGAMVFLGRDPDVLRAWFVFPTMVWAALAFSVRGASLALFAIAALAMVGVVLDLGPFSDVAPGFQVLLTQEFVAVIAATALVLAAATDERRQQEQLRRSEERLRAETEALEVLNATGAAIAAELDLDKAVQRVTDAGVALTGAQFGAFFYNVTDAAGESYMLYALSGAPREAFERFGHPRNTEVFAPTFNGEGVVRSPDITKDPRYGKMAPHYGMPKGHLPVRSYLAVPVRSRSGAVIGGLFFGHSQVGVFTERAERLLVGIAGQAAIAIDNAQLYRAAQAELRKRETVEATLRETDRRLNAVLDNATVAIFLMNERQECVYMNAAAEKLTGFTFPETQGRPLHDVIHHTRPDGSHFPLEECAIDRAFPENNQQQGEEVFVHKDGRFYPVAFTASPIRDEAAKTIGTIIEVRDVTQEKEDQRARDLLMREVDHRARNALSVVQSILQLTKAQDIESFREVVLGRVEALARAQGSLAQRQWHGAPLPQVIEGALSAVAAPEAYTLTGPPVMLPPEQVQPVSMIVHELATNARKYGALGAPGGRLTVEWRPGPQMTEVVWRERGGPPAAEPETLGFGSRLVRGLANQIGGSVEKDWAPEGVTVRLVIPASRERRVRAAAPARSTPAEALE